MSLEGRPACVRALWAGKIAPQPDDPPERYHHPIFGLKLKEAMDKLGSFAFTSIPRMSTSQQAKPPR